jgi:hypothetical protein
MEVIHLIFNNKWLYLVGRSWKENLVRHLKLLFTGLSAKIKHDEPSNPNLT